MKCNWNQILSKVQKTEYNKKGKTVNEGMNCFSMILNVFKDTKHNIPLDDEIYKDYTFQNIYQKWQENWRKTVADMTEYLQYWCSEIPNNKIKTGDVLLLEREDGKHFPAICAGSNKILAMFETGPFVAPITYYKLIKSYRMKNTI